MDIEAILQEITQLDTTDGIWDYPCLRFTSVCFFGIISDMIEEGYPALYKYTQDLLEKRQVENVAIFIMDPDCMVPPHTDPDIFGKICRRELLLLTNTKVVVTQDNLEQELIPFVPYSLDTSLLHSAINQEETSYILCLDFLKEGITQEMYEDASIQEEVAGNLYLEFNRQNVNKTYWKKEKLEKVLRRFSGL